MICKHSNNQWTTATRVTASVAIGAIFLLSAAAAHADPTNTEVFRSYSALKNDHMVSTNPMEGAIPYGYHAEIGYLFYSTPQGGWGETPAPAHMTYRCRSGTDHFLSTASNCEGQLYEGQIAYLLDGPRAGHSALYRCRQNSVNDHFISTSSSCEGHIVEGPLGYIRNGSVGTPTPLVDGTGVNDCLGKCGAGCKWMPWEAWTGACMAHDTCVRDSGQLACVHLLSAAVASYVIAGAVSLMRTIWNALKGFFKWLF